MACHVLRMTCFFLLFFGLKHHDAETLRAELQNELFPDVLKNLRVVFLHAGCC